MASGCMYFALMFDTCIVRNTVKRTVNKRSQGASERKTSTKLTPDTTPGAVSDSETRRGTFSGATKRYQQLTEIETLPAAYRDRDATIDLHKTRAMTLT